MIYHVLGREYGWQPSQIDKTPKKIVLGLLTLLRANGDKQRREQEKLESKVSVEQEHNKARLTR